MEAGAEDHGVPAPGSDPPAPLIRHIPVRGTLYALYSAAGEPDAAGTTSWYLLLLDERVVQVRIEQSPSRWARAEVQHYPRAVLDALCQVPR